MLVSFAVATLVLIEAALSPLSAQSTAPSAVTPPTLRPDAAPRTAITIPEAAGLQAPSGADKLSVTLRSVAVEGAFDELAEATRELIAAISGRRLSVLQIYKAIQAYEAAYARAGYVLVRLAVPPQQLVDGGTLRVTVIDGFIETIDANGVPDRVRSVVIARTTRLIGKRRIVLGEIERRLLIAGDAAGLRLRSTLARGDEPGGTKLILDGTHRLVTGAVGTDNRLPQSLGTWQINGSVSLNSALGLGEQIYGALTIPGDPEHAFNSDATIRVWGAGMVLPIGVDGWTISPEYTRSRTSAKVTPGTPVTVGWFNRFALRTSYPVIRKRTHALIVQAAFEAIEQRNEAVDFNVEISRDRYQVMRTGVEWTDNLEWGQSLKLTAQVSRGLGGRDLRDATLSNIPLSRIDAEPIFWKFVGDARFIQPLPERFAVTAVLRGQLSFGHALLRPEQFALDAVDGLSSFVAGTFPVDEGVTGRVELSRSFESRIDRLFAQVSPYVFYAAGTGTLKSPSGVEPFTVRASTIGGGLRGSVDEIGGYAGIAVGVEYGRQYTDYPGVIAGHRTMGSLLFRY